MDLNEIMVYVHEHMPLTKSLGATLSSFDGSQLVVDAPLAPNINHRNSAFGGSLSAIGILSGWACVFIKLKELGIENKLVIQGSQFEFDQPVVSDFQFRCSLPSGKEWERFIKLFNRKGCGRLTLTSELTCRGETCGRHIGQYVALKPDDSSLI